MTAPVRAAVVGCGDVSIVHTEALAALAEDGLAELVAVCDTDAERGRAAAERLEVPAYDSVDALLAAGGVDVVHVTTPHHEHVDVTLAALRAGVHVLQEKPVAHTMAEARRLVEAADSDLVRRPAADGSPRVHLGICFQNRYNASSVALRELLDAGDLGDVLGAYASVVWTRSTAYYEARPWRGRWATSGGGLLNNQAPHTLDLLAWVLGEPVAVSGAAHTRVYGDVSEVEDTAEAVFTHPGGVRSTFFGALTAPRHRQVEVEVTGTRGTASIGPAGLTVTMHDGTGRVVPERVANSGGRSYWGVSHELLIRDFYAHLGSDSPFWIGPRDGLVALGMANAIYDQSDFPQRSATA